MWYFQRCIILVALIAASAHGKDSESLTGKGIIQACRTFVATDSSLTNRDCFERCMKVKKALKLGDSLEEISIPDVLKHPDLQKCQYNHWHWINGRAHPIGDCFGTYVYGYSQPVSIDATMKDRSCYKEISVSTPAECQAECQGDKDCANWAMFLPTNSPTEGKDVKFPCLLKNEEQVQKAVQQSTEEGQSIDTNFCNYGMTYSCNHTYNCLKCDGQKRCAYESSMHITGWPHCEKVDQCLAKPATPTVPPTITTPITTVPPTTTTPPTTKPPTTMPPTSTPPTTTPPTTTPPTTTPPTTTPPTTTPPTTTPPTTTPPTTTPPTTTPPTTTPATTTPATTRTATTTRPTTTTPPTTTPPTTTPPTTAPPTTTPPTTTPPTTTPATARTATTTRPTTRTATTARPTTTETSTETTTVEALITTTTMPTTMTTRPPTRTATTARPATTETSTETTTVETLITTTAVPPTTAAPTITSEESRPTLPSTTSNVTANTTTTSGTTLTTKMNTSSSLSETQTTTVENTSGLESTIGSSNPALSTQTDTISTSKATSNTAVNSVSAASTKTAEITSNNETQTTLPAVTQTELTSILSTPETPTLTSSFESHQEIQTNRLPSFTTTRRPCPNCTASPTSPESLCARQMSLKKEVSHSECMRECEQVIKKGIPSRMNETEYKETCRSQHFSWRHNTVVPDSPCFTSIVYGFADLETINQSAFKKLPVATPALCAASCQEHYKCVNWIYDVTSGLCGLKSFSMVQDAVYTHITSEDSVVDGNVCEASLPSRCFSGEARCLDCCHDSKICAFQQPNIVSGWKYCTPMNHCDPDLCLQQSVVKSLGRKDVSVNELDQQPITSGCTHCGK